MKHLQWDFQWDFQTKWANHNKANFGQNNRFPTLCRETSLQFCNLEVKIRIEFLAMQNCESRNCQFSGKSRNIQNCFWRPSSRFTSLLEFQWPWTFCCRQKFETCMKQMFSEHFKKFNIPHVSPKQKCVFIAVSIPGMGFWDQKVLVLFSLLLRGEIGYEIKTEKARSSKHSFHLISAAAGIAPHNLTQTLLVLCP